MLLDEAKQILKENGFICEEVKADLNNLKPGEMNSYYLKLLPVVIILLVN